tara:strand:+ start:29353 stop:29736 length:384 start_codon:yes stop_codon:yes gene_type:complete
MPGVIHTSLPGILSYTLLMDYSKVWKVMNDLDEVIEQCRIIQEMSNDLGDAIANNCDDDEILNRCMTLTGVSKYMFDKLQHHNAVAWNNTVVALKKEQNDAISDDGTTRVSSRTFENIEKTGLIDLS